MPSSFVGGGTEIRVKRESAIPALGERPPRVDTETIASSGGDIKAIDTRDPSDDMHEENFADMLGDKPVVLLMATPALCQTRVCGPVTDITAQLQEEYGDRATFIHQEVYEDNDVQKGLREPLRRFGLQTEPGCSPSAPTACRRSPRRFVRQWRLPRRGRGCTGGLISASGAPRRPAGAPG
jgi:hypothetical protein